MVISAAAKSKNTQEEEKENYLKVPKSKVILNIKTFSD